MANSLSINSVNLQRAHIVSQMDVRMGTGVGVLRCSSVCDRGRQPSQVVMPQSDECPEGSSGVLGEPREGASHTWRAARSKLVLNGE